MFEFVDPVRGQILMLIFALIYSPLRLQSLIFERRVLKRKRKYPIYSPDKWLRVRLLFSSTLREF